MSQHRHLILTKSIIALLFLSSLQIAVMPANGSALFLSDDFHPCSRTSMSMSSTEQGGNSDATPEHMGHSCIHCKNISSYCMDDCNAGSLMMIPVNTRLDLETRNTDTFYSYAMIPPTFLQQPKVRPPRL